MDQIPGYYGIYRYRYIATTWIVHDDIFSKMNHVLSPGGFPFPIGILGFVYFVIAGVHLFPALYLNNFSNYASKAIAYRETEMLTIALKNMKKLSKFIGIATIVFIVSYPILIITLIVMKIASHNQPF